MNIKHGFIRFVSALVVFLTATGLSFLAGRGAYTAMVSLQNDSADIISGIVFIILWFLLMFIGFKISQLIIPKK